MAARTSPGSRVAARVRMAQPAGRWVLLATVLGSGMVMLDATVVNVALNRIGEDLDAGLAGLQWTLNGYTLTLAAFILLAGSLSDRLGRRRMFLIGIVWFAAASMLCGLAPDIRTLIAARALQGAGGALLTPGSLAIISASFHPEDRARAIGAWSGLGGLAAAIGPFVGGWLIGLGSWRLVFLINAPLAAVVVAVAVRHVPETRDPDAAGHLDLAGTVLGALGLAGVTYASIAAAGQPVSTGPVSAAAVGVAALGGFVAVQRRSASPLVPPDLFASRQFTTANLVTFAVYGALGTAFFLLVLQLQVVSGFDPLVAGTALLPVTVMMLTLSARSSALAERIGPRLQLSTGPAIAAAGLLLTLRIGPAASYWLDVVPATLLFGLGLATLVAPLTATVLAAAPAEHVGVASGVNNAVARAAGLLAVALVPTLAGLDGADYRSAATFDAGFRNAIALCSGLLLVGALIGAVGITNRPPAAARAGTAEPESTQARPATDGSAPARSYSCPLDSPHAESRGL